MAAVCLGWIESRESILKQIQDANDYVATHCYYCQNCWQCRVTSKFQQEMKSKGIKTFNKSKKWWQINWREEKNGE